MRLIAMICLMAACAFAQNAESRLLVTDAEKIADALRAGPTFITKDATQLDWPSSPKGEYRVLRKGTNEWTCLPGIPGYPTTNQDASTAYFFSGLKTAWLASRRTSIESEWHICMVVLFVNFTRELLSSTSGRT